MNYVGPYEKTIDDFGLPTTANYIEIINLDINPMGIVEYNGVFYASEDRMTQAQLWQADSVEELKKMINDDVGIIENTKEKTMSDKKTNIKEMNRGEALSMDRTGDFYVDYDEDVEAYVVFGTESAFAYATFMDEDEAEEYASNLRSRQESNDSDEDPIQESDVIEVDRLVKVNEEWELEPGDKIRVVQDEE